MHNAFIFEGVRSPFGRHGGALASMRPDDLMAAILKDLLSRAPMAVNSVEDVIIGCTNQAGEDARNVARHAMLLAGMPVETAAITVNRLCGSGLAAVLDASRAASVGQGGFFIAGGVESMSRAPFVLAKSQSAYSRDFKMFDSTIGARFPNPKVEREFGADTMPETADNIAAELQISREASDVFALASQEKYQRALAAGFFDQEISVVNAPGAKRGEVNVVVTDEHPRPDATFERLSALNPLSNGGVVTAGNASGVNDGAAALLIGTIEAGESAGVAPRARVVSGAVSGISPRIMGLGPVHASRKALERASLTLSDMDVIEINEAFSVQVLGCLKELGVTFDDERVNPNGGAIAIGHPLGASGARLALTAMRQLEKISGRYALIAMCIGVGQGIAAIIERVRD